MNAVFRVEVLKAEVEWADLNAERARVRDAEAIVRLLLSTMRA